jgi:hypothetical protein
MYICRSLEERGEGVDLEEGVVGGEVEGDNIPFLGAAGGGEGH